MKTNLTYSFLFPLTSPLRLETQHWDFSLPETETWQLWSSQADDKWWDKCPQQWDQYRLWQPQRTISAFDLFLPLFFLGQDNRVSHFSKGFRGRSSLTGVIVIVIGFASHRGSIVDTSRRHKVWNDAYWVTPVGNYIVILNFRNCYFKTLSVTRPSICEG